MSKWMNTNADQIKEFKEFFKQPEIEPELKDILAKCKLRGGNLLRLGFLFFAETGINTEPFYSEFFELFENETQIPIINAQAKLIHKMKDKSCYLMLTEYYRNISTKFRNYADEILSSLDDGLSFDSLASKIKKLDITIIKLWIMIKELSISDPAKNDKSIFKPVVEIYSSDSLVNDMLQLLSKVTTGNLTRIDFVPKLTQVLNQLESNLVMAKLRDQSVDIENDMMAKFAERIESTLECTNSIFENDNYDEDEKKELLNFVFVAKCQRARFHKSDFLNKKMKISNASDMEEDFVSDLFSFYDLVNFDLQKDDDEKQVPEVLKEIMSKTYAQKTEEYNKLLKEQEEANKDAEDGFGGESAKKKRNISKKAKGFKDPVIQLKEFEDKENEFHFIEDFKKVTATMFNLSYTCFFSGGYNLAYNLLKRLYIVKGGAESHCEDQIDQFIRKLVIADLNPNIKITNISQNRFLKLVNIFIDRENPKYVLKFINKYLDQMKFIGVKKLSQFIYANMTYYLLKNQLENSEIVKAMSSMINKNYLLQHHFPKFILLIHTKTQELSNKSETEQNLPLQ